MILSLPFTPASIHYATPATNSSFLQRRNLLSYETFLTAEKPEGWVNPADCKTEVRVRSDRSDVPHASSFVVSLSGYCDATNDDTC